MVASVLVADRGSSLLRYIQCLVFRSTHRALRRHDLCSIWRVRCISARGQLHVDTSQRGPRRNVPIACTARQTHRSPQRQSHQPGKPILLVCPIARLVGRLVRKHCARLETRSGCTIVPIRRCSWVALVPPACRPRVVVCPQPACRNLAEFGRLLPQVWPNSARRLPILPSFGPSSTEFGPIAAQKHRRARARIVDALKGVVVLLLHCANGQCHQARASSRPVSTYIQLALGQAAGRT